MRTPLEFHQIKSHRIAYERRSQLRKKGAETGNQLYDDLNMATDMAVSQLMCFAVMNPRLYENAKNNLTPKKPTSVSSAASYQNPASEFSKATGYGIDIDNLNFSNTVQNHTGRPYQDSKLLINEIIESKPPVRDPRGTNAWSWTVEGTFNGSTGYYELIIDPESNTVWHFVFKSQ